MPSQSQCKVLVRLDGASTSGLSSASGSWPLSVEVVSSIDGEEDSADSKVKIVKICFNQRNDTICTNSTQILWLNPTSSHHKLPMVVHKLRVWPHQLVSQWKQDARKQKKQRKERRPHLMLEFPLSLMWHVDASVDVKWSGGIALIAGLSFALTAKSQVSAWQIERSYVGSCMQPSITWEESRVIDNNEFWHIFRSGLGVDVTYLLRNFWFQWLEYDPIGCGYFFMPPPWPGLLVMWNGLIISFLKRKCHWT